MCYKLVCFVGEMGLGCLAPEVIHNPQSLTWHNSYAYAHQEAPPFYQGQSFPQALELHIMPHTHPCHLGHPHEQPSSTQQLPSEFEPFYLNLLPPDYYVCMLELSWCTVYRVIMTIYLFLSGINIEFYKVYSIPYNAINHTTAILTPIPSLLRVCRQGLTDGEW